MTGWLIRPAGGADADAVAEVWLAARRGSGDLPSPARSDANVRRWMRQVLLSAREVWVVEVDGRLVAMMALDETWLDQLYVHPSYTGQGVGTALLDLAKVLRPDGFGLWTFVSNMGAQRFYRRHGFVEVERTDGRDNEEHAPDIRMVWRP
jgi:ribosomal protein S18 acetylase RimI-like enzyme